MAIAAHEDRFETLRYVSTVTGLKTSAIYKRIKSGSFPKPIKLGYASRWSRREIQDWMSARKEERAA